MNAILYATAELCHRTLQDLGLLFHVVFVALRGLYRSRGGHDPTASAAFRSARRAAYRQRWAMLEESYWKLRERNSDNATLGALLRDANAFVLENSLYIETVDRTTIIQYIVSLQLLREAIYSVKIKRFPARWDNSSGGIRWATLDDVASFTQETAGLHRKVEQRMRRELRRELHRD